MNLPNKITLSRILLVPVFMLFVIPIPLWMLKINFLTFIHSELILFNKFILFSGNYIGAIIFIIAASTDGVDGYIARKKQLETRIGKFLDPIADKLLITAALIALVQRGSLTGWAAMIIIGREFLVTAFRLVCVGEGVVIAASKWGKIKTITQVIAIVAALISEHQVMLLNNAVDSYLMLIAIIITIYSGYDYIKRNISILDTSTS